MKESIKVFVSVGRTRDQAQAEFITAIESRLRSEGLIPCTVGRNFFKNDAPLKVVTNLMKECHGAVVIALERFYFPKGVELRDHPEHKELTDVKLPTIWNQTEAAMAYLHNLPTLLIAEHGLRSDGFLEKGYEWPVHWVGVSTAELNSAGFNGAFSDWKEQIIQHFDRKRQVGPFGGDPESITVRDLFTSLGQLPIPKMWGLLSAILTFLITIASVAYRIGADKWPWD